MLLNESLYIGVDIGKHSDVAGFVSTTLLARHKHFEGCPVLTFEQSSIGFHQLISRIRSYVPIVQCFVLMERTGHYYKALEQFLLDADITVYVMHVQKRANPLLKTDKRDALSLANHLYNQLEHGIQVSDKTQLVRQQLPPTIAAAQLRGLVRHRYELIQETTQRKNKLIAICDELFPEFTSIWKNPNRPMPLSYREAFPTPQTLVKASLADLRALKNGHRSPSDVRLLRLQSLAKQSIGTRDKIRQHALVFEQRQLIAELRMMLEHLEELDQEIERIVRQSREGQILISTGIIGPIQAATLIATIGNILNFSKASELKSYLGWAPKQTQTGVTIDTMSMARGGNRATKQILFLVAMSATRLDCEWADLYRRLVSKKCRWDARTQSYRGKLKVIGRVAGQIVVLIYALLRHDADILARLPPGATQPAPMLYDRAVHHAHRTGQYAPLKRRDVLRQQVSTHEPASEASLELS